MQLFHYTNPVSPNPTTCQTFQNQFALLLAQTSSLNDSLLKFTQVTNQTQLDNLQKGIDDHYKS